jgi:lipopolysaccharide/colanic/teichoic acid biosynthesis glycosyltransferase
MLSAILKRTLDVAVAAVLLIVFSPLLLITALAIRLQMGSPVVFRHQRPGRHRVPFVLLKFRTMNERRDAAGRLLPDTDRLTGLGRLLRRTSLDELPQLLNVLAGEMSLVGPRPLLTRYLPYYTPRESLRFDVRPGITGWAQLHGRNRAPWDERLERDAWYVEHQSLGLDLRILWKTLGNVFRGEGVVVDAGTVVVDLDAERSEGAQEEDAPRRPATPPSNRQAA